MLSEVEKKVDAADNGIVPAWSTQLAEVALPIKFKLKNIEETERASALDAARAEAGPKSIAAGYRFNSYERAPKVHPSAEGFLEEAEAGLAGPIAGVGAGAGGDVGNKRPLKSSDDRALDQYKKVRLMCAPKSTLAFMIANIPNCLIMRIAAANESSTIAKTTSATAWRS